MEARPGPAPPPLPTVFALSEAHWRDCYEELRTMARARLRAGPRHEHLQTTVLVHESCVRILSQHAARAALPFADRQAFLHYASAVMRSVIVDLARERQALRRGGGVEVVRLATDAPLGDDDAPTDDPLWVDNALDLLAAREPRLAKVVEMRFFGGYAEAEIAELLGVTDRTVRRDWDKARALMLGWLA